jgi:hypothetical protein
MVATSAAPPVALNTAPTFIWVKVQARGTIPRLVVLKEGGEPPPLLLTVACGEK